MSVSLFYFIAEAYTSLAMYKNTAPLVLCHLDDRTQAAFDEIIAPGLAKHAYRLVPGAMAGRKLFHAQRLQSLDDRLDLGIAAATEML